ncbi:hypothetical protein EWM64_g7689 [Hericium alpestre]|uniref:Alpha N-terminal protein methyltransferase 1 n=1 Tax=Hericium alpestre TaxID=135208 RepID=A0A4Y9ZQL7_9AGAM|nr:hypothetical protein EWM64_g7689 [Hericium alpestre]
MSPKRKQPDPVVQDGIKYWSSQPASYDGVLGGWIWDWVPPAHRVSRIAPVPHASDAELCTVPSAIRPLNAKPPTRRIRALDVGAGIGRVTADTLLHLVDDAALVEPVDALVQEAYARGTASMNPPAAPAEDTPAQDNDADDAEHGQEPPPRPWKGIADKSKSVSFFQATLQEVDPASLSTSAKYLGRVGYTPDPPDADADSGFDVVWCQWCLMYMGDEDLVAFLRRAKKALRTPEEGRKPSVIVVKENVAAELEYGKAAVVWDEEDSSVTRSDLAWKAIFKEAGLQLFHQQVQKGLPEGLFTVKMYALK